MVVAGAVLPLGGAVPAGAAAGAAAAPSACVGEWRMHTVFDFDLVRPMRHSFELVQVSGSGQCDGAGMLNGVCFGATGGGVMQGRAFDVQWRGATLVFSGGVVGTLSIAADSASGDACIGGTADDFVLAGALTLP